MALSVKDFDLMLSTITNQKKILRIQTLQTLQTLQTQKQFKYENDKQNNNNNYNHNNHNHNTTKYSNICDEDINNICNGCKSSKINEIDGFYVCKSCGLFNESIIDSGQEWRFYGSEDNKTSDPARCDLPTNDLLPKTSIGGLVGFGTRENRTSKRIRTMSFWNSITYKDSKLIESFNNITIMSQNSGISQCIIDEAKYMYKKVSDIKSSRRTKKDAMKAGCIMLACKLKGVPRNCDEIASIFKLKNNKIFRKSIKTFEEIWNNIQILEKDLGNSILEKNCKKKILEEKSRKNIILNSNNHNNNCINSDSDSESDSDSDSESDNSRNSNTSDSSESESDNSDDSSDSSDSSDSDLENINIKTKEQRFYEKQLKKKTKSSLNSNCNKIKSPDININQNINTIINKNNKNNILETSSNKNISSQTISKEIQTLNNKNIKEIRETRDDEPKQLSKSISNCITKLHRFSCILGFNEKVFDACRIILIHIETNKYLDKHNPLSRTSTVIYYIIERLKLTVNKNHVIKTCGISEVTITKCYQKLLKYKQNLLNIDIGL